MTDARHVLGTSAAAATGAGTVTGAALLCRAAARDLDRGLAAGGWQGVGLDALLGGVAALVVAAGAAWLGLTTVLTVVGLVTGVGHSVADRVTPAAVRRTVAVVCGAALCGTNAWTAVAAEAPGVEAPGAAGPAQATWCPAAEAHLLAGLPLPDRAVGHRAAGLGAPARVTQAAASEHVVRPGESLWSVTAGALRPGARTAEVAAGWRRLYALNRDRVGDDADLLLPGTTLRLPSAWTAYRARSHPSHREDPS